MSSCSDSFPELTSLVRQALGDVLTADTSTLLSMMTDDILFEFPYALPDGITKLDSKAALAAYLPLIAAMISIEVMSLDNVIIDASGERAMLEISCRGTATRTGLRYDQHYVCVLTLREGHICRWRDYWDPMVVLKAMGGNLTLPNELKGENL